MKGAATPQDPRDSCSAGSEVELSPLQSCSGNEIRGFFATSAGLSVWGALAAVRGDKGGGGFTGGSEDL